MIKFKDILTEIEVNNPNKQFGVTPKGKQAIEDTHNLVTLALKYGLDDLLTEEGMEIDKYRIARVFNLYSDTRGEGMIKVDKVNTLGEFLKLYTTTWGDEEEVAKEYLKMFIKEGYLTPIKL